MFQSENFIEHRYYEWLLNKSTFMVKNVKKRVKMKSRNKTEWIPIDGNKSVDTEIV